MSLLIESPDDILKDSDDKEEIKDKESNKGIYVWINIGSGQYSLMKGLVNNHLCNIGSGEGKGN